MRRVVNEAGLINTGLEGGGAVEWADISSVAPDRKVCI